MDWQTELARQIAGADPKTLKRWSALEEAGAECAPSLFRAEDQSVLKWRVQLLDLNGEGPSFKEAVKEASQKRRQRVDAANQPPSPFCLRMGVTQSLSELEGSGVLVGQSAVRIIPPEFYAAGMQIIVNCEYLDHEWAHALAAMLDGEWGVVAEMWESVVAQTTQMLILDRVSNRRLYGWDLELYKAVRSIVRPVQNRRNRYVHWLWGVCLERDLRDRLCLVDPRESLLHTVSLREQFGPVSPLFPDYKASEWTWSRHHLYLISPEREMLVFRLKDIEQDIAAAQEATRIVRLFGLVAARGDKAERARQQLSAELRLPQSSPPL